MGTKGVVGSLCFYNCVLSCGIVVEVQCRALICGERGRSEGNSSSSGLNGNSPSKGPEGLRGVTGLNTCQAGTDLPSAFFKIFSQIIDQAHQIYEITNCLPEVCRRTHALNSTQPGWLWYHILGTRGSEGYNCGDSMRHTSDIHQRIAGCWSTGIDRRSSRRRQDTCAEDKKT
jgi:hypothetical protein